MSKAFVREENQDDQEEIASPVLPGGKNYITPAGFKKLQEELKTILEKTRPELTAVIAWAAGNGDRSENADYIYGKRRLRELDRRIRFLTKRIESAEVVDPALQKGKRIFFGARVTVEDEEGEEKTYTIVGVDEIDLPKNRISWVSPLASALLKKEEGEIAQVRTPQGVRELEIIKVEYQSIE